MQFVSSLGENPFATGDFSEKDDAGRTVQVRLVGRFAITFWADHAVSEVEVTHIKPAHRQSGRFAEGVSTWPFPVCSREVATLPKVLYGKSPPLADSAA